eukprot:403338116
MAQLKENNLEGTNDYERVQQRMNLLQSELQNINIQRTDDEKHSYLPPINLMNNNQKHQFNDQDTQIDEEEIQNNQQSLFSKQLNGNCDPTLFPHQKAINKQEFEVERDVYHKEQISQIQQKVIVDVTKQGGKLKSNNQNESLDNKNQDEEQVLLNRLNVYNFAVQYLIDNDQMDKAKYLLEAAQNISKAIQHFNDGNLNQYEMFLEPELSPTIMFGLSSIERSSQLKQLQNEIEFMFKKSKDQAEAFLVNSKEPSLSKVESQKLKTQAASLIEKAKQYAENIKQIKLCLEDEWMPMPSFAYKKPINKVVKINQEIGVDECRVIVESSKNCLDRNLKVDIKIENLGEFVANISKSQISKTFIAEKEIHVKTLAKRQCHIQLLKNNSIILDQKKIKFKMLASKCEDSITFTVQNDQLSKRALCCIPVKPINLEHGEIKITVQLREPNSGQEIIDEKGDVEELIIERFNPSFKPILFSINHNCSKQSVLDQLSKLQNILLLHSQKLNLDFDLQNLNSQVNMKEKSYKLNQSSTQRIIKKIETEKRKVSKKADVKDSNQGQDESDFNQDHNSLERLE